MRPAPIVFLDFDGVTHPNLCEADQLFSCLPLIENVLRRHVTVEVVISSSWREPHPLSELREFFSDDMALRVVGCTPEIHGDHFTHEGGGLREAECRTWLAINRPYHPWIAIDDKAWNFMPSCPNLILTDPCVGFSPVNAFQLESFLDSLASGKA